MEVTRKNFDSVMKTLPEIFKKAQFLTFDTEFTGLEVEGASDLNFFDTLEDLYLKDRLKVETFIAIQFGIVAFFYDSSTKKYSHQAFNFYIYPSSYVNVNFTCQNKCIAFLMEHGFDFNKLFKDGIPYLKDEEVEKLLEKLEEKFDKNYQETPAKMEIPQEHKSKIDEILQKIHDVLEANTKKTFDTERFNAYIRRLIYSSVLHKYESKVFLESNKNETMTIYVGFDAEEVKELKRKKFLTEKNKILDEAGFSKVIKLIIESGKLLVGHNLFLDLLFTIKQFLAPLPNSYSELKELVRFLFPNIIDTKYMASSQFQNIKDTSLYNLLANLDKTYTVPEVEVIESGQGYRSDDKKLHEAAYDAYLTGLCFLTMSKYLGITNFNTNIFNELPESVLLKSLVNKLSTPRLCDIYHMNLGGNDNVPDRLGVYHLTFPKDWTRDNISTLFGDYGFMNIAWINSTSAFIRVKKEFIKDVEKNLMKSNSNYKLWTYKEFKSSNQSTADLLLSPLMEKRLGNNLNGSANNFSKVNDTPVKFPNETTKKRKIEEDIGEVIERPQKKISK